jgi:hypothetical protein
MGKEHPLILLHIEKQENIRYIEVYIYNKLSTKVVWKTFKDQNNRQT